MAKQKKVPVSARIPEPVAKWIKELSDKHETSVSEEVANLLAALYVKNRILRDLDKR